MNPSGSDHASSADNRTSSQSSLQRNFRETSQQIRGSVSDLVSGVTEATRNLTKVATGRGVDGPSDNDTPSQDNDDASGD